LHGVISYQIDKQQVLDLKKKEEKSVLLYEGKHYKPSNQKWKV
jgi:hypothetical protein